MDNAKTVCENTENDSDFLFNEGLLYSNNFRQSIIWIDKNGLKEIKNKISKKFYKELKDSINDINFFIIN